MRYGFSLARLGYFRNGWAIFHSGNLALMAGIAGGAEAIVIPEVETDPELIAAELRSAYDRGKAHAIVVVAEGAEYNAEKLARYFKERRERLGFDLRPQVSP